MSFVTLFSSNIPMDCHMLRCRLESEGIEVFIRDEKTVSVHPFFAVAVGGVKLQVPTDQYGRARQIMDAIHENKLVDEGGVYDIPEAMGQAILRQNEILEIKARIRGDESLLDRMEELRPALLSLSEIAELVAGEREFNALAKKEFKFSWKEFLVELIDFESNVFEYLHPRPVEYYHEKELVDLYKAGSFDRKEMVCPQCHSDNVSFGHAFDYKWDIPYLVLSLVLMVPLPPIRRKYHCFDCGKDFREREVDKSHIDG